MILAVSVFELRFCWREFVVSRYMFYVCAGSAKGVNCWIVYYKGSSWTLIKSSYIKCNFLKPTPTTSTDICDFQGRKILRRRGKGCHGADSKCGCLLSSPRCSPSGSQARGTTAPQYWTSFLAIIANLNSSAVSAAKWLVFQTVPAFAKLNVLVIFFCSISFC